MMPKLSVRRVPLATRITAKQGPATAIQEPPTWILEPGTDRNTPMWTVGKQLQNEGKFALIY